MGLLTAVCHADFFVAVTSEHGVILRFDDQGTFVEKLMVPDAKDACRGVTVGPDHCLYAACGDGRVMRYDGKSWRVFGPGHAELKATRSLAFGADGHLYVSNGPHNQIFTLDGKTGAVLGIARVGTQNLVGLTNGLDKLLYVVDREATTVYRCKDGKWEAIITKGFQPSHFATADASGTVYVTNLSANTIVKYVPDANGVYGEPAGTISAFSPNGLAWGPDKTLYVACVYGARIQKQKTPDACADFAAFPKEYQWPEALAYGTLGVNKAEQ
jgi:sugar lactone lactonase YvrE